MSTLALHLRLCGLLLLALAALQPVIARHLKWKEELAGVSLFTRQVFVVHAGFITLILVQFGVLSLMFPHTLIERTTLARVVLAGFVMFWGLRLLAQYFVYSPKIWRGDRFRTTMHVVFAGFWTYLVAVYAAALWLQLKD